VGRREEEGGGGGKRLPSLNGRKGAWIDRREREDRTTLQKGVCWCEAIASCVVEAMERCLDTVVEKCNRMLEGWMQASRRWKLDGAEELELLLSKVGEGSCSLLEGGGSLSRRGRKDSHFPPHA